MYRDGKYKILNNPKKIKEKRRNIMVDFIMLHFFSFSGVLLALPRHWKLQRNTVLNVTDKDKHYEIFTRLVDSGNHCLI